MSDKALTALRPDRPLLCTFYRDGQVCARVQEDESVHLWPDERMRRGAHVWRHDHRQDWRLDMPNRQDITLTIAADDDEEAIREKIAAILDSLPREDRIEIIQALRAQLVELEP